MKKLPKKYHAIMRDNRTRSILKAISYRVISLFITFIIGLIVTKNIRFAFTIGGIDLIAKIAFYYIHERVWHYSTIGRK